MGSGHQVHTLETLNAVEFRQQLVDNTVSDTCAVVPTLRSNGIELVEEKHARSRRRCSPAATYTSFQQICRVG